MKYFKDFNLLFFPLNCKKHIVMVKVNNGCLIKWVSDLFVLQLLEWQFDWTYMVRGLVLDKKRGCILKVGTTSIIAWH